MTTLAEDLVPDKLWQMVAPLLPAAPRPWYGGRRRTVPDRSCFAAILYMARTSTPWRLLPVQELGCGSPTTAWRRLDEWRASVDSASVRAKRGGPHWRKSGRSRQAGVQDPPRCEGAGCR